MRFVILGVRAQYCNIDNLVKKQNFVSGEWSFGSLEFVRSNDLKALLTKRYGNEPFKFAILDVKSELCPVIPLDGLDNLSPQSSLLGYAELDEIQDSSKAEYGGRIRFHHKEGRWCKDV